jgi:hypothetical protein
MLPLHVTHAVVARDACCRCMRSQFRSLSDQLYGTPHMHVFVRECVVLQLSRHAARYAEYVPSDFRAYCKKMSRKGEWGDHVTLQVSRGGRVHTNIRRGLLPHCGQGRSAELENTTSAWLSVCARACCVQAAADFWGLKICLVTSYEQSCFLEIVPHQVGVSWCACVSACVKREGRVRCVVKQSLCFLAFSAPHHAPQMWFPKLQA